MTNILIGIFIMSTISVVGMVIKDKTGKDIDILTSGPALWIVLLIYAMGVFTSKFIRESKQRSLIKCPDGSIRHCSYLKVDRLRELEGYNFPKFEEVGYPAELWQGKYSSGVNLRYAPKRVWKNFQAVDRKIMKSLE